MSKLKVPIPILKILDFLDTICTAVGQCAGNNMHNGSLLEGCLRSTLTNFIYFLSCAWLPKLKAAKPLLITGCRQGASCASRQGCLLGNWARVPTDIYPKASGCLMILSENPELQG